MDALCARANLTCTAGEGGSVTQSLWPQPPAVPERCLLSFCCFCSCHVSSPVFSPLFCSAALQPGRPPDWSGQRHTGTLRRLRARLAGLQAACRCTGLLAQPQQRRLSGSLAQLPAHLLGALQTKPGDPASNPAFFLVFPAGHDHLLPVLHARPRGSGALCSPLLLRKRCELVEGSIGRCNRRHRRQPGCVRRLRMLRMQHVLRSTNRS